MIIALSNHKGGVGKTTSAVNIGAGLAKLGNRVLLVDMDPQANLSQSLRIEGRTPNIYQAIHGEKELQPIPIVKNLDAIPSTLDLTGAEMEFSGEAGREFILSEILQPLKKKYDYIIIDSPPSLGLLTINALTAADQLLIPLQAQYLAMQGVNKMLAAVEKVRSRVNKNLKICGVFVTQYDGRKVLDRNVSESIDEHFTGKVFKTQIRDNVALAEAPVEGVDIFRYNATSYGAADYLSLCKEIIQRTKTTKQPTTKKALAV